MELEREMLGKLLPVDETEELEKEDENRWLEFAESAGNEKGRLPTEGTEGV